MIDPAHADTARIRLISIEATRWDDHGLTDRTKTESPQIPQDRVGRQDNN
jgi:hypothetical protein